MVLTKILPGGKETTRRLSFTGRIGGSDATVSVEE
jgi:hypothetical protein